MNHATLEVEMRSEAAAGADNAATTGKNKLHIIAGTQAVKRTSDLIPFCHPLPIESCRIAIALSKKGEAVITCTVSLHHKTGVEMEAMTGAAVAALTVYDMCKGVSHDMVIREVQLLEKTGGKSDVRR